MEKVNVAIVGATGAVGEAMREILAERGFPLGEVHLLASERSVGKRLQVGGQSVAVQLLDDFDFGNTQIALFSAGGAVSGDHAPRAAEAGAVVIDNTSKFRMEEGIPLVVPEVNGERIADGIGPNIIANPNCSTIQMAVALKPIYDAVGIRTHQRRHLPGGLRRWHVRRARTGQPDGQSAERQAAGRLRRASRADRLQRHRPRLGDRRQRLFGGGDEDGQRDQEDLRGRRDSSESDVRARAGLLRAFGSPAHRDRGAAVGVRRHRTAERARPA